MTDLPTREQAQSRVDHLRAMHVAVKGDTNRRGGRYDQADWKGPRP